MANKKISELIAATSVQESDVLVGNAGATTKKVPMSVIRTLLGVPVVSAADNGKFLMVEDGEWTAVTLANAETTEY